VETGFFRRNGELTCDGVALSALAREFGTPLYVYSWAAIEERWRRFDAALGAVPHLVCYAMKANSSFAILRRLAALGSGADVVSGGELRAALACGIPADRIVFSGVGKTDEEIAAGVDAGILAFNAESQREIEKIAAAASARRATARVALRVNPDIDARSHPYISTGLKHNKFGVGIGRAREIFAWARQLEGVRMVGVQAHIGSQIVEAEPLAETARELAALATALASEGHAIEQLDLGGGIGIGDGTGSELSPEGYAAAVFPALRGLPFRVLIEPGRSVAGPAGVLLARVLYAKTERGKNFVVLDAGMNDLIRPALYEAIHPIECVAPSGGQKITADVVGPVCETGDFFLRDAVLDRPEERDLLAIGNAGAYGFAMSSNYNFRLRPAEILVEKGRPLLARRRETFEDFTRLEHE
jgi:diaminopimelate decarboxylase